MNTRGQRFHAGRWLMTIMTSTSIPVKPETLARLRALKTGGATYDELLNELLDANPPEAFVWEHLRRLREEERVSWRRVKKKQGP